MYSFCKLHTEAGVGFVCVQQYLAENACGGTEAGSLEITNLQPGGLADISQAIKHGIKVFTVVIREIQQLGHRTVQLMQTADRLA